MHIGVRAAYAIKNLPPFPPVAARVITLLASESVSLPEVADILKTDPSLSAEVLRLANSALFGARSEIKNVRQSLSFLGIGRLTALMLTLSLSKVIRKIKSGEIMRRLWRHNLASALAAKEFAPSFGRISDDSYSAALLHDLGRLVFLVADSVQYEALVREGSNVRQLEREYFGADHCEVGAQLLKLWNLPEMFSEVARHHHDAPPDRGELILVVNASCAVANQLGFSVGPSDVDPADLADDSGVGRSISERVNVLEREYGIRI